MAIVFVGGSFKLCGNDAVAGGNGTAQAADVIAEVDGEPITAQKVQADVAKLKEQYASMPGGIPADQEAFIVAGTLGQTLQQTAMAALAKKAGISITDDQIRQKAKDQFDKAIVQFRAMMESQGKLKPGAPEAELDKQVKAQTGKTLAEIRKANDEQLEKALKDQRPLVEAAFLKEAYLDQLAKANPATEEELRASFDNYTLKRILLPKAEGTKAQADKIVAELKGGLKFEDAMNRYSKDLPMPNKKVADNTITVTGQMLSDEQYKPIKGLKVGEVSPPVDNFEGTVIYKVVAIKAELPKDFEKNKAMLLEQRSRQNADTELVAKTAGIAKGEGVVWKNDVYKALFSLNAPPTEDPKARDANLRAAADAGKAAALKAASGQASGEEIRLAGLLRYAALSQLANSPTADKAAIRKEQIEAINDILKGREDVALRLKLVTLYSEDKNPLAGTALLEATKFNTDYSDMGQGQYAELARNLAELKKASLIKPEDATLADAELARWRTEKAKFEKNKPKEPAPTMGAP
ncbi:hypothetical protein EON79_01135, partial [bacterium]